MALLRRVVREGCNLGLIAFYLVLYMAIREEAARPHTISEPTVLVLGSMGAGTQVLTQKLRRLGLYLGHERTAPDGTVSWLHMLIFRPNVNATALCATRGIGTWSPKNLGGNECDTMECCIDTVEKWRGCWPECPYNFGPPLIVARHPLRTIESLAATFCRPDVEASEVPQLKMAAALLDIDLSHASTCLEAFALYWRAFYSLHEKTKVRRLQREDTSACDVVKHFTTDTALSDIQPRLLRALGLCRLSFPSLRYAALILRQFFTDLRDPYSGLLAKAPPKSPRQIIDPATLATFDNALAQDLKSLARVYGFSLFPEDPLHDDDDDDDSEQDLLPLPPDHQYSSSSATKGKEL